MKKIYVLLLALIISMATLFSACGESKKYEFTQEPTLNVEYNEYLGYSAEVTGSLKNISGYNYSYAQVEFSVYDASGNNLGTALANINNLAAGDTWKFTATLLSFPDSKPTSFKLVDVTMF